MTREVMEQALHTLENVNPSLVCEMAHHPKKDQHGVGQKCPLEIRHLETIAAIKETLAQPVQEPVAMLERNPRIGILKVTYEDAVTDLEEGVYALYTKPQGWRDHVAQAYLKGFDEGERRYRWLRKEFSEGRETYVAESVSSENALDEYVDRQMAKTSIKTQRWSGK